MIKKIYTLFTILFFVRAEPWYEDSIERMVDVTNRLGLKVLYQHSLLNDNNIAFSPYGLTCVVVAVYEGVDGSTAYQVQRAAELPWNVDVLRAGFRDIHRTLKTYFVPEEGFLDGLSFNMENITFKQDYQERMAFYGFNSLANDTSTTVSPSLDPPNTEPPTIGAASTTTPEVTEATTKPSTEAAINPPSTTMTVNPPSSTTSTTMTTVVTTSPFTTVTQTTSETIQTTMSEVEIIDNVSSTGSDADMTELTTLMTSTTDDTLETLERRKKRSLYDYIIASPIFFDDPFGFANIGSRSYDIGDETNFLVNGLTSTQVDYMIYDNVLDYGHFPQLKTSALKLPLDNDNYYLLILLPDYGVDVGVLIKILAQGYVLREISHACQPRLVHACVPSFMVKGSITLTRDLQRLGMRDMFEPRQNDFTPMTEQKGVYVRNVEQAVSVTMKKYPETRNELRHVSNKRPVRFSATSPFVYFVMDKNLHIALMAGKMMDPLNTRIL